MVPPLSTPEMVGTSSETTVFSTSPVVALTRFLRVLGRTGMMGRISNLRLFDTTGTTVKVCQPARAGLLASQSAKHVGSRVEELKPCPIMGLHSCLALDLW